MNTEFRENLSADAIVSQRRHIGQRFARLHAQQLRHRHFAIEQHHHAFPLPSDLLHGAGDKIVTVAGLAEHVGENIQRMHSNDSRLGWIDMPLHQGDCFDFNGFNAESDRGPFAAPLALKICGGDAFDIVVMAAAKGDKITNRTNLEAVKLREGNKIIQTRHRAVVLHDLADHA